MNQIGRSYLETHLELLTADSVQFLDLLISQYNDAPDEQRQLRIRQSILQDAITRGGTQQAVREAYMNVFGGLVLDLPLWLLDIEKQIFTPPLGGWTDRSVAVCKIRLREALERAEVEELLASEIIAELQYILGNVFLNYSPQRSAAIIETAVHLYRAALTIYTFERYPLRHAKVLAALDYAYLQTSPGRFPHEEA